MAATNDTLFTFSPAGSGKTKVTWEMTGEKNFMSKAFFLVADADKMIEARPSGSRTRRSSGAADFEKSRRRLASMKSLHAGESLRVQEI